MTTKPTTEEIGKQDNPHLLRQLDIIPLAALGMPVTIIGCGAIGSFTALALVKMGLQQITIWDFDDVSVENMSNQFFRFSDIGRNKADALQELIHDFTNTQVRFFCGRFDAPTSGDSDYRELKGIVIVAVDSMAMRKQIFEGIKRAGFGVKYIIDPRMGAEFYAQYTVNPFDGPDGENYEKTLYTDENAVAERCTAKSTIYTATSAAGLICKTVKDIIVKAKSYPGNIQWDIGACKNPMVMWPNRYPDSIGDMGSIDLNMGGFAQPQFVAEQQPVIYFDDEPITVTTIQSPQAPRT